MNDTQHPGASLPSGTPCVECGRLESHKVHHSGAYLSSHEFVPASPPSPTTPPDCQTCKRRLAACRGGAFCTNRDCPHVNELVATPTTPAPECEKAPHYNGARHYFHASDDDGPYEINGKVFCGRCHQLEHSVTTPAPVESHKWLILGFGPKSDWPTTPAPRCPDCPDCPELMTPVGDGRWRCLNVHCEGAGNVHGARSRPAAPFDCCGGVSVHTLECDAYSRRPAAPQGGEPDIRGQGISLALALFASVIRCGESWTPACAAAFESAKKELAALLASPPAGAPAVVETCRCEEYWPCWSALDIKRPGLHHLPECPLSTDPRDVAERSAPPGCPFMDADTGKRCVMKAHHTDHHHFGATDSRAGASFLAVDPASNASGFLVHPSSVAEENVFRGAPETAPLTPEDRERLGLHEECCPAHPTYRHKCLCAAIRDHSTITPLR